MIPFSQTMKPNTRGLNESAVERIITDFRRMVAEEKTNFFKT